MNVSSISNTAPPTGEPWSSPWPADELQHIKACPACGNTDRTLLYQDLVDNVFFVAPGRWTLHLCAHCKSAYLDPRPNEASIGKAYGTYYTHSIGSTRLALTQLGMLRRLQRLLANGYVNRRYGTHRLPASRLGFGFLRPFPRVRQKLDVEFRYLPKPNPGQKLLDIGCGNGSFLASAVEAGWDVAGIDPDPQAVAAARQRGFDVRQGLIDSYASMSNCFDAITLSHVIEHVHEPKEVIQAAYRLLKPGGLLYIDTPNIASKGCVRFGRNWRPLETPRHLVIFSFSGLIGLLVANKFGQINIKRRSAVKRRTYLQSLRMQSARSPYGDVPPRLPLAMWLKLILCPTGAESDEFLTLIARKDI